VKNWRPLVMRGALLVMESLWAYALIAFLVLVIGNGRGLSYTGVALVVAGSFALSRALQSSEMELVPLRAWGIGISLLLFYALVRVDFFADWRFWDLTWADDLAGDPRGAAREHSAAAVGIPLFWLLWLRGVLRGQETLHFESVIGSFSLGVVVIAVVEAAAQGQEAPPLLDYVALPYIAVGLIALGLAHAERPDAELGRTFTQTWMATGAAVLLLSFLALVFVVLDYGAAYDAIVVVGRAAGWVLYQALFYFLSAIYYLLQPFFEGMGWLLGQVIGNVRTPRDPTEPGEGDAEPESVLGFLPDWVSLVLRIIGGGIVIAAIVLISALIFARLRRRARPGPVRQSTYQEGRLSADLGDLLGSLLDRLKPRFGFNRDEGLEPVRRLYFEMLTAGSQRGVQRAPAETPLELAPRLDQAFAAPTPGRITEVFEDARYGGLLPTASRLAGLQEEWRRVASETSNN
jgi:hypothetical protein